MQSSTQRLSLKGLEKTLEKTKGAVILAAAMMLAGPALARGPGIEDHIVLDLATEGWVETKTAEVVVAVNATLRQEQSSNVRETILAALKTLAPNAEWRITNFNRNADQSGLDSWYVTGETRIADTGLDGLRQAAEKASQPGMAISVSAINFTPTVAEVEATRARLRQDLYAQAQAELDRVNKAFPEAHYHIGLINFTGAAVSPMQPQFMARADMASAPAPKAIAVQDRIELQATVTLTAAGATDEGGK